MWCNYEGTCILLFALRPHAISPDSVMRDIGAFGMPAYRTTSDQQLSERQLCSSEARTAQGTQV